uniref:Golgi apparatus membrane protein TVP23 n=1 Tax=Rhizophora mucronata TaxID=61149 RepID=A0A2P2JJP1_RHIMU
MRIQRYASFTFFSRLQLWHFIYFLLSLLITLSSFLW